MFGVVTYGGHTAPSRVQMPGERYETDATRWASGWPPSKSGDAPGAVGREATTKEEKYAAVLASAANKQRTDGTVAVTGAEIRGYTGVSRRYASDLVEAMAADIEGVRVREPTQVQAGSGIEQKSKALLVDCEQVHRDGAGVNQFTTGGTGEGGG